jgi:hypothetical protein
MVGGFLWGAPKIPVAVSECIHQLIPADSRLAGQCIPKQALECGGSIWLFLWWTGELLVEAFQELLQFRTH